MKIEDLQIELRPRTNAQALDLGFTLLRSHAGAAYMAFLALWLPLMGVIALLTYFFHELAMLWMLTAWWLKPLLERAPLYVLSRKVFGATVTWQEAVRAWPRQLSGGWFRLLTWGRLIAAGRSLYQPVWQLEGARGSVAQARMQVLGRKNTGQSAFFFGLVCFQLEIVLQLGMQGFVSIFISEGGVTHPFYLLNYAQDHPGRLVELAMVGFFTIAVGIIAPIYTACGFTLYLNRRAALEAWDIEMQLRQIRPPAAARLKNRAAAAAPAPASPPASPPTSSPTAAPPAASAAAMCLSVLLVVLAAVPPADAAAASASPPSACKADSIEPTPRGAHKSPQQAALRAQVDAVFASEAMSRFECVETWHWKNASKSTPKAVPEAPDLAMNNVAGAAKIVLIAIAIAGVAWLLIRYGHHFPGFASRSRPMQATEVGGLDIRLESLPPDVATQVRALWRAGQRRAALALLYRATLARLVADNGLQITQGDTEGDCLRRADAAHRAGKLGAQRFAIAGAATTLWLGAAYGDRWPAEAELFALCSQWEVQFARGAGPDAGAAA